MKMTLLLILIALFKLNSADAQIEKPVKPVVNKTVKPLPVPPVINKTPPSAPPAPATNKSTGTGDQTTLVYSLTAVKANIRTGNDNKEYPSAVSTFLTVKGQEGYAYFEQGNLANEMRSNSNTEFGLEKKRVYPRNPNVNLTDISLAVLETTGFRFTIIYKANLLLDAWKIEGVTVTLEFRDQNGNLHPSLGQKTITFSNAIGFLNGTGTYKMICDTDGYFNPLSAYIE